MIQIITQNFIFIRSGLNFLFLTENEFKFSQIRHFLKFIIGFMDNKSNEIWLNLNHFLGNRKSLNHF